MSAVKELTHVKNVTPRGPNAFTLELVDGTTLEVHEGAKVAIFPYEVEDGLSVLTYGWGGPEGVCYAVPMELLPVLLPYFPPMPWQCPQQRKS